MKFKDLKTGTILKLKKDISLYNPNRPDENTYFIALAGERIVFVKFLPKRMFVGETDFLFLRLNNFCFYSSPFFNEKWLIDFFEIVFP